MKKAIKDIKIGDKIKGTDGKWYNVIDKTEQKIPYKMYKIQFNNGYIKCSDTHQWNIYVNNKSYTMDTEGLFQNLDFYKNHHIGTPDGAILENISEIEPEIVQCITTDASDNQFMIYTKE